jgi:hypothetical protein
VGREKKLGIYFHQHQESHTDVFILAKHCHISFAPQSEAQAISLAAQFAPAMQLQRFRLS